ncbi:MAG TPA: hypothetical protein VK610_07165 [Rhodothermales bacterium]|nr:hypothetical protein [Rhodothermales bacterium]
MAFSLHILPQDRLAVVRYGPAITGLDVVHAAEGVLTHEAWEPTYNVAVDWRDVRHLVLEPEHVTQLRETTRHLRDHLGPGRTAALIRRDADEVAAAVLLLRAWRHPDRARRIFRNVAAAEAWLGLTPGLLRLPTEPMPQETGP